MNEPEPPAVPSDVDYVWVTPDHEVVLRELRGYVTLGMSNDGFWAGERTTAELPADAVRLVPDTGQAREPTLIYDAEGNFHGVQGGACEHRTVGSHRAWCHDCREWCYPTGPCVRCKFEPSEDTVQAPDVAAAVLAAAVAWKARYDEMFDEPPARGTTMRPIYDALLGADPTPVRLAWIDTAAETAAAERHPRYQETACARRPAATSGDPAQPDLAYARSEVDKWLADNDPYCILPTRTEHIPALLARLDELEGTR